MVRVLVSVYTREEHWPLPAWFPAAYLIDTTHNGAAGEHWVGVFLEDSRHAKYFDSYSTTLLESIYQWSQSMGYRDMWYSIRMLQGSFSRSCGLYAFFLPGHAQPGFAIGGHYICIPGIRLCLHWGPDQTPSRMPYAHMLATALAAPILLTPVLLFAQPIGGMETLQSTHSAEHHWWSKKSIAPKDNLHHTSVFPLTVLLDVSLSSPPATMVPVHDMKHASKGSAQVTIRITWGHSRICHLQQAWLDCPCELLEWTGLAPTVCLVPGQEWLTMQHYGHTGFIWGWGPRARHWPGRDSAPGTQCQDT